MNTNTRLHTLAAALVALAAPLGLASCAVPAAPLATTTPAPTLLATWSGNLGGPDAAGTRIVGTSADWNALWQQLGREPPQPLNPAREQAIALFLGQRRTTEYRIEIVDVVRESGQSVVRYREHAPARDQPVGQMLTAPWAVALIDATTEPVSIRQLPPVTPPRKQ